MNLYLHSTQITGLDVQTKRSLALGLNIPDVKTFFLRYIPKITTPFFIPGARPLMWYDSVFKLKLWEGMSFSVSFFLFPFSAERAFIKVMHIKYTTQ